MQFPLTFSDISLWLAVTAIIVLVTSELLNSYPKVSARIAINRKLLRMSGLGLGVAFLVTVVMRVIQPF
jgi:VIT1/CCC1 family predicted Fe2+/Mn2+ transporter